jgi:hypothetical protein
MTHSKNTPKKTLKNTLKNTLKSVNRKNISERKTKKNKKNQKAGDYSQYEDTKMLDFMKIGVGFDRSKIAPMPQPPECSIL